MPSPDRLIESFEHSKWGWMPSLGGEFRVQIEAGSYENVLLLLQDDERRKFIELQQMAFRKIRAQPFVNDATLKLMQANGEDGWGGGFMPYWDERDIKAYTEFLVPLLPRFAATVGQDPGLAQHFRPAGRVGK